MNRPQLALMAFLLVFCGAAKAEHLYDNGGTTFNYGYEMSYSQIADDFKFSASCLVTGVKFWTTEGYSIRTNALPFDGHIDYWIYENIGGRPGSSPMASGTANVVSRTPVGLQNKWWGSMYSYEYAIDMVQPVLVQASTSYFLALHMLNQYPSPNGEFYWATTDAGIKGSTVCVKNPGWSWNTVTQGYVYDMAFQVYATQVPEPSVLVLLGIAALSLLGYASRRRGAA